MLPVMRDPANALGPKTIGPYRILAELARGRLASIFLAQGSTETEASSRLVIKRVLPELAQVAGWGELLSDEALLLASIQHPNVVASHGSDKKDGGYVALDYVEGDSLEGLLSRSDAWRQPRLLLPVIADALRGLAAAHAALTPDGVPLRVVHQAPSARHILVGTDGRARMADFTQALVQKLAVGGRRTERLRGGVLAPEQTLDPKSVDLRADLFVLGATLWEGLTGESLLGPSSGRAVRTAGNAQIPKPSSLGLAPLPYFDALCLRALERDPDRRFSSAEEMLEELLRAARRAGAVAPPSEIGQWVRTTCAARARLDAGDTRADQVSPAASSELSGTHRTQQGAAESLAQAESPPSKVQATRATLVGMPADPSWTQEIYTVAPQPALAQEPPPSTSLTSSPAPASFSKTLLGSPKVQVRLDATLQGGAGGMRVQLEPITSEPPAYRRDLAPPKDADVAPEDPRRARDQASSVAPPREWSSVHDTRWADFAVGSPQLPNERADSRSPAASAAAPAQASRNLGEQVVLWAGTVALVAVILLLGNLVVRHAQRWPDAPAVDDVLLSAGHTAYPPVAATERGRGQPEPSTLPVRALEKRPQVAQAVESAPRPNATRDTGARDTALSTTALPGVAALRRVPSTRPAAPAVVAPALVAPTMMARVGVAPAGVARAGAAPSGEAPSSLAPQHVPPVHVPSLHLAPKSGRSPLPANPY